MQRPPSLIISTNDVEKIATLLAATDTPIAEQLEDEIGRARIVAPEELPTDAVAMNRVVTFLDLDSQKEQQVTLVYPHEASIDDGRISILAPIGAALIGLEVGQTIEWPMGDDKVRRIQVTAVTERPA